MLTLLHYRWYRKYRKGVFIQVTMSGLQIPFTYIMHNPEPDEVLRVWDSIDWIEVHK